MKEFMVREKTASGKVKGPWEKVRALDEEQAALLHSQMVKDRELLKELKRLL